jgi:maltose O-acetyltransferase
VLGFIRRKLSENQIRKTIANCRKQAVIGEWFGVEHGGKIVNYSDNIQHITIGHHMTLGGEVYCSPNGRVRIGNYVYLGMHAAICAANSIEIGNYVGISNYTFVVDNNNHPIEPEKRIEHRIRVAPGGEGYANMGAAWEISDNAPIVIEDNVWIGMFCYIGKGIRIGEGSIVARQSVVTKDVPPYVIVAGNPARIVKQLTHNSAAPSAQNEPLRNKSSSSA